MKGYWNRPEDTARTFTEDGWLKTGDIGEYNETGLLRIRGRIKEIIVTSTGEKIPPVDLELAIETDPIFAQTYVVGDDRPFISLVTVLNPDEWKKLAATLNLNPEDPESLKTTAVRNARCAAQKPPQVTSRTMLCRETSRLSLSPGPLKTGCLRRL